MDHFLLCWTYQDSLMLSRLGLINQDTNMNASFRQPKGDIPAYDVVVNMWIVDRMGNGCQSYKPQRTGTCLCTSQSIFWKMYVTGVSKNFIVDRYVPIKKSTMCYIDEIQHWLSLFLFHCVCSTISGNLFYFRQICFHIVLPVLNLFLYLKTMWNAVPPVVYHHVVFA